MAEAAAPDPLPESVIHTPSLTLVGMAEDREGQLTAIIAGPGQLFLVTNGERVTSRYRLSIITPYAVDLIDIIDGTVLTMNLK